MSLSTLIPIIVTLLVIILVIRLAVFFKDKIKFYSIGFDSQFKGSEISALWKLAKECDLDDPLLLYYSVPMVNKCIAMLITKSRSKGTQDSPRVQNLLDRLYKYRTRIALESDGKKGLDSSRYLEKGQKLTIVYPGKGVFTSRIRDNGREMIIEVPRRLDKKTGTIKVLDGSEWVGKNVGVYFWRKGDAMYSFETRVFDCGLYLAKPALFLKNSSDLVRTQKRQSIRSNCNIYAQMYMIKSEIVDYSAVERENGYKCLLEDISEDGALIRIGGKGVNNVQIKLQFTIEDTFVMMYGIVKGVEYNSAMNQSRLHFECVHIDPVMKNAILTYVYRVIPANEAEINEAMLLAGEDAADGDAEESGSSEDSKKTDGSAVAGVSDGSEGSSGENGIATEEVELDPKDLLDLEDFE